MDKPDKSLATVLEDETQAAIQQNKTPWIPPTFATDITRSLLSIPKTQGISDTAHDDVEFPYDRADPVSKIGDVKEESSEEDSDIEQEETDKEDEEDTDDGVNKLEGGVRDVDWNTFLQLSTTMRKSRREYPSRSLDIVPEVDYEDNVGARTSLVKDTDKTTSPGNAWFGMTIAPDYDKDTNFGVGANRPISSNTNVGHPGTSNHTHPAAESWTGTKLFKPSKKKKDQNISVDVEMRTLSNVGRRYPSVSFHENTNYILSTSNLQDNNPLNLSDLAKLPELTLDTITDCIEKRYKHDLIYSQCGEILISVNPFKHLELCTFKYFKGYTEHSVSETPHLFAVSARAYQNIRRLQQNQVILVSGESGSGKTEATKHIVRHLMNIAGSDYSTLQDRIIQVNPLLEAFGNAKTELNNNSSRFAKFLTLNVNTNGKIESARVKDYMLEKSRVVHHGPRERTFHTFYALLVGGTDKLLESLHIKRGDNFRVTGDFSSVNERERNLYQTIFVLQQNVFKLIKLEEDEIQDIYTILAAILHLGNVEFEEGDNDSVIIKNEHVVYRVASLLQTDVKLITKALIERTGRIGKDQKTLYEIKVNPLKSIRDSTSMFKTPSRGNKLDNDIEMGMSRDRSDDSESLITGEVIELSKNKKQAEDERDATAKSLYERLFGWLVRKINDSLSSFRNPANIGILDICGFENLNVNSLEQLCINLVNEQLQNFMNKIIIEDERVLYIQEGVEIGDVDIEGINNDAVLRMFLENKSGILDIIDEDSRLEFSSDDILVSNLSRKFGNGGIFIPPVGQTPDFKIRHFAGTVAYDARSFIQKNRDTMSETMKTCFLASESIFIQDLFSIQESETGSISMAHYHFRGSKKPSPSVLKPLSEGSLSVSINQSRKTSLQQKYGDKSPIFQSGDLAQRSTHIKFFRNSLTELLNAMKGAHPYFVKCIKPNDRQIPGEFSRERVKAQLQYNGMKEIARIRTYGFPVRFSKENFKKIYGDLANKNSKTDLFHDILENACPDISQYKLGSTQIFMKEPLKSALDSALITLQKKQEEERKRKADEERLEEERKMKERWNRDKSLKAHILSLELAEASGAEPELQDIFVEPIVERTTPASFVDDPVYNKTSSSINESLAQTADESDDFENTSINIPDEKEEEDKPTAPWDITQELTEEEERHDVHEQPVLMVIKFIVYIFLFVVILAAFVIQKVGFLLLTTGLKSEKSITKNKQDLQTVFVVLLIIAICIPYALGWIISVGKLCFGNFKSPSFSTWVWVFIMESFHSLGLCLLVFRILPNLDVFRSTLLLSATAIIPALLKVTMSSSDYIVWRGIFTKFNSHVMATTIAGYVIDILVILGQVSVIPLILRLEFFNSEKADYTLFNDTWFELEIVGTFLLVSCAHWENFTDGRLVSELGKKNFFKNAVLKIRYELQNGRHYPHIITYLWKIGITLLLGYYLNNDVSFDYADAMSALSRKKNRIGPKAIASAIAMIISGFVAFYASFGACMFQMQVISLTIPAFLAVPTTFLIFYLDYQYNILNFLETDAERQSLFFNNHMALIGHFYQFLFGVVWWFSFIFLNRHMFFPAVDRTANMARLFINHIYCGILTSESVTMNRIRNPIKVREYPKISLDGEIRIVYYKLGRNYDDSDDDDDDEPPAEVLPGSKKSKKSKKKKINDGESGLPKNDPSEDLMTKNEDNPATPILYACATMWHETRTEMVQLLKSLHRLDRDQYIRRMANEEVKGHDPEFYHYEAHIFFDDAMEPNDDDIQVPNKFLKELVSCMDVACSSVHGKPIKVHPPVKVPTPYGGQLIWQMPGENLLFVHMKDIKKIRNRKRWSQVMYMYYLLGYRHLMASKQEILEKMRALDAKLGHHGLNIRDINYLLGEEAAMKANNTFLLALDGDTDFSPGAIKILLDRMKNEKVGAACGRIHPIGSGPMVWYQKFEYAIGHWLQKAAEHVFGCVLCSPGCFSLFRAAALMDTNVMKKYTTEPKEASDHLQFDQGEDRWLCTLLLQQGYRIEYAAAADAWTFAPEGFFEFFNQRRRWMPSTIANILDLLGSATSTTKRNDNMSKLYIGYQWLLMLMTILGPGTIIMMIAGAAKLVFKMSLVEAYIFSIVPAVIFTVVCFWFNSKIQLIFAAILSVVYTFIMMIVLVGTIITATTENIFHPSVIVIVVLIGIFVISGLCHPQEVWCLAHGVMYLLTIPSGYLLLVIFSICNLNDVSWGTREVPTKAERLEAEKKKKEKEELEKNKVKKGFWARIFNRGEEHIRELTKLVKTLVPQKAATSPQEQLLGAAVNVGIEGQVNNDVLGVLMKIERNLEQLLNKNPTGELDSVVVQQPAVNPIISSVSVRPKQLAAEETTATPEVANDGIKEKKKKKRNELKNPLWAEDRGLGSGKVILGNTAEMKFWADFIKKYLEPIHPTPEEKKKITEGLRDLRNSSSFGLIIVNLLWMAVNFMFQLTNAARFTITYGSGGSNKIEESILGMGFVFLLLLLLIIQMFGMFIHRMGTLQHLLAITEINLCKTQQGSTSKDNEGRESAMRRIREVLKLPMLGDIGAETLPPVIAPASQRKWGMTVLKPSLRGTIGQDQNSSNIMSYIGKTIHNPMLGLGKTTSFNLRMQDPLNSAKQRMVSGSVFQKLQENEEFGKSFRPRLPPPRSFHQPMVLQSSNWGFTQRELEAEHILVENQEETDTFQSTGALGRSLYQRSKFINETNRKSNNSVGLWADHDLGVSPRKHSITSDLNRMY